MDLSAVLSAVGSWPSDERLQLIEEIWEQLADEGYEPPVTDELKAKLDRRLAALDANPQDVTTWDAITRRVRESR